jgi:putative oxidoreductase
MIRLFHYLALARTRLAFLPPLLARITLGVLFMGTGWGKVHSLDKVAEFFAELGIPAPAFQAAMVSWIELVGGALILVGFAARSAAVPLAVSMVVALITAKASEIHGASDLFGTVEFTYFVMLVWIAIVGPGPMALDRLLARKHPSSIAPVPHGSEAATTSS